MPDSEFQNIGADAIDPNAKWDKFNLWFDKSKDRFLWKKPDASWSAKKKDLIKIQLGTQYGLSDLAERDEKGRVIDEKSELDYLLGHAMTYKEGRLTLGGLSGHEAAVETTAEGDSYLIEKSAQWVSPVKGEWETIKTFLHQVFGEEQLVFILGWLAYSVRCYYGKNYAAMPAMILAGPKK